MNYIVTRHQGAVEWLKKKGFPGEVIAHLEDEQILPGNVYIGSLPVPAIKAILNTGSRFLLLILPDITFSQRGREMTPEEMDRAGAQLLEVTKIELVPVETGTDAP